MQEIGVKCATDITGFGLSGHLHKLTQSSNCGAEIYLDKLPYLPQTLDFAFDKIHSSILEKNEEFVSTFLEGNYKNNIKSKLLFDPQTSGGIMLSVTSELTQIFKQKMESVNLQYFEIGKLVSSENNIIKII
jgi:selenide,water dikinase